MHLSELASMYPNLWHYHLWIDTAVSRATISSITWGCIPVEDFTYSDIAYLLGPYQCLQATREFPVSIFYYYCFVIET